MEELIQVGFGMVKSNCSSFFLVLALTGPAHHADSHLLLFCLPACGKPRLGTRGAR